ncbi:MAG: TetR/AcrR family transcriptional regulator [Candidatus Geothermincolia bacterium]
MVSEHMQRKKEEKREQITESARKLFLERGFYETRMEDIAESAGLAIGTLYLYFKNKNEIYASICEQGLAILDDLFRQAVEDGADCWQKMEAMAKVNLRFYRKYGNYYDTIAFLFFGLKEGQLSRELREKTAARIRGILAHLEQIVREGMESGLLRPGDPKQTAIILWAAVLGMVSIAQTGYLEELGLDFDSVSLASMGMAFRGLKA